jgi:hypothetical protein
MHLDGPLTVALTWGERQKLTRGTEPTTLDINIGTPGLAARNSRYPVFSPLLCAEVPDDVHALADIEFPGKSPTSPAIRVKVSLNQRC